MKKRIVFFSVIAFTTIIFGCNPKEKFRYYYYDSGELQYKYTVVKNKRNGESLKYYKTGEVMLKSKWVNDMKEGYSISFYKNGQIKIKAKYVNNYQEGWVYKYDSLGNLLGKTTYKKSVPEGPFETYFLNGEHKSKGTYSDKGRMSQTYFYYKNGAPFAYEVFKNDTLFYMKEYTLNGKLRITYFPLRVSLSDELCINLLHSIIPKDSISIRVYFQDTKHLLLNTDTKYFQSDGLKVCTNQYKVNSDGIIEGFLCEYYKDINYGCMPFKYDTNKKKEIRINEPIMYGNK